MVNSPLVKFIKQGRARGFDDYQLREPLIKNGWDIRDIEEAFASFKQPLKFKNKISVWLDNDILKIIEKRANRNLMTTGEQIEDIIRRSAVNVKPSKKTEKLDDKFIAFFSRKKR
ncbi:MAG: hypothetical protein AABW79_03275 [Nanoarchaeota archaeon]